jgi:hypothetical protein
MSVTATETKTDGNEGATVAQLHGKATQFGTLKIEKLPDTFADGSSIIDRVKASAAFDTAFPALETWVTSDRAGRDATRLFCEASFLLRTFCRNNVAGIDWAGNTDAYSNLWKDRVTAMQKEAGMSKSEIDRFTAAVRGYNRDNDALRRFMAKWLAANDAAGKLKTNEQPDGTMKPNAALVKAMQGEAKSQVSASTKKPLQGFDAATYVQQGDTVGAKKAAKPRTPTTEAGSTEPPAQFEQLRAAVVKTSKTDDGKTVPTVAPLRTASEVLHLVTSASIALFGNMGDTEEPFPFLGWEGYNREELAAAWMAVGNLANMIGAGIKNPEAVKIDKLKGGYWKPSEQ